MRKNDSELRSKVFELASVCLRFGYRRFTWLLQQSDLHAMQTRINSFDNGPVSTDGARLKWSAENNIELDFIRSGKPMENAISESFNERFRDE